MDLAVLAGILSTGLFAMSYLPMLMKAVRTRDLSSYSFGNLAITNIGNAVHSLYVFSLPLGPIWFLHTFYLLASALMLAWFLRYRATGRHPDATTATPPPAAMHAAAASADVPSTAAIADAALRLGIEARLAPVALRPVLPGVLVSGRSRPVMHLGSVDVLTETAQADRMRGGESLREQLDFTRYRERQASDPDLTLRRYLQERGGAIEV